MRFGRKRRRAAEGPPPPPRPAHLPALLSDLDLDFGWQAAKIARQDGDPGVPRGGLGACGAALDWADSQRPSTPAVALIDVGEDPYWGICLVASLRPALIGPLAAGLVALGLPGKREGAAHRAAQLAREARTLLEVGADEDDVDLAYHSARNHLCRAAWVQSLGPLPVNATESELQRRANRQADQFVMEALSGSIRELARSLVVVAGVAPGRAAPAPPPPAPGPNQAVPLRDTGGRFLRPGQAPPPPRPRDAKGRYLSKEAALQLEVEAQKKKRKPAKKAPKNKKPR